MAQALVLVAIIKNLLKEHFEKQNTPQEEIIFVDRTWIPSNAEQYTAAITTSNVIYKIKTYLYLYQKKRQLP